MTRNQLVALLNEWEVGVSSTFRGRWAPDVKVVLWAITFAIDGQQDTEDETWRRELTQQLDAILTKYRLDLRNSKVARPYPYLVRHIKGGNTTKYDVTYLTLFPSSKGIVGAGLPREFHPYEEIARPR